MKPIKVDKQTIEELDRLKQKSREEDVRQLKNGEKTPEQLSHENGFFCFPQVIVHYP